MSMTEKATNLAYNMLGNRKPPKKNHCTWTKYWDWVKHRDGDEDKAWWETSCNIASSGDNGLLTDDFIYCHNCGLPIDEDTKEYERERMEAEEDWDDARMEVVRREQGLVGK